jgi:hypothetical protein
MDDDPSAESDSQTTERDGTSESLVETLADELEAGTVPDEDVERLRAALFDEESRSLSPGSRNSSATSTRCWPTRAPSNRSSTRTVPARH